MKATAYQMIGREQGDSWPKFPYQLVIQKSDIADPLFFKLMDQNVLLRMTARSICRDILKYWQVCPATATYRLMPSDAKVTLDFFESFAASFDELIEPVLFASEIGYCFRRLPFDRRPGLTPTFDELMTRTRNAPALMAWIGSLFDSESERQQYIWLYGEGMNGKSSLAKFLQNIFKDGATAAQPPGKGGGRFWAAQFLGKRLAVLPDCDDYTFVNSGYFKAQTGGDRIPVEEKCKGIYSVDPTWKFFILSNQKPAIEDEVSAVRRAIYCEILPISGKRVSAKAYQAMLAAEAQAFLTKCIETYERLCPDGGAIESDPEITRELTDMTEEKWAFIANRHLCLSAEGTLDDVPYNAMPFVTRHYMRSIQKMENLNAGQYQSFLNYLNRKHGVKIHNVKVGGQPKYVYIKCSERGAVHYADSASNGKPESEASNSTTGPTTGPTTGENFEFQGWRVYK